MMVNRKKPPLLGIPPSVKITDLAARHGFQPKPEEEKRAMRDKFKLELAKESLNVPAPNSRSRLRYDTEVDDAWASLPVTSVHFYERNPRKANNEAFAELKESIRVNGILQPLSVTKRPGENHYILFAGGNTRLQAIRELWEETGDEKFRETRVIVKKWRGESAVLIAHMAENTQRNDMTFWDRANGTLELKKQLEDEGGQPLSHRDFESALKKAGVQVNLQSISAYRFAVERVPDIGPWLSGLSVRNIQPRLNLLLKLANHHDLEEDTFYSQIVTPAAKGIAQDVLAGEAFSADQFLAAVERALCSRLDIEARDMGRMLTAIERFPNMTLEDLRKLCKPAPPASTAASAQVSSATLRPGRGETGPETTTHAKTTPQSDISKTRTPTVSVKVTGNNYSAAQQDSASVGAGASESEFPLPAPENRVVELVQEIVVQAGLGSCYEAAPDMPLGYVMGFPKDGPLDLKEQAQSRQAAWWVLSMASGQFDPDTCRAALDEANVWRGLILEESDAQTLGGLELEIQHNIGGQGEFLAIPWLMNTENPIAGACLSLLSLIREVRP